MPWSACLSDIKSGSITRSDIKSSSITGADVRRGSITSSDLNDRTEKALDGKDGAKGNRGTRGPASPAGPRGAEGPAGPPRQGAGYAVKTLDAFHAGDSELAPPAWGSVRGASLDDTGIKFGPSAAGTDFQGAYSYALKDVRLRDIALLTYPTQYTGGPSTQIGVSPKPDTWQHWVVTGLPAPNMQSRGRARSGDPT